MKHLTIRPLESRDVDPICAAFSSLGWNKPRPVLLRHNDLAPYNLVFTRRREGDGHRRLCGARNSRKPENPYSHLSLLT
jgi:hypothetical protein